jgi:KDO2-lipid IV(A) lauroyltransferase
MLRKLHAAAVIVRDSLLTIPVLVAASPLWLLPWSAAVRVGRLYGAAGFLFWGKARRAGMINLVRAWPGLSLREARMRTARVFVNMGASIAEGIQFSRRPGESTSYVAEDPALEQQIAADPRPKIFVTAHLGSWEVALMIARAVTGGNGAVIARAVDNRFLDAVVRRIRFRQASEWIEKRGAIQEAVARLEKGQSVAMLIDENGGPRGPHVPFFGRPASTRKTPAVLSVMTGAPIVIGAALRREGQPLLFRLAVIDPRDLPRDPATIVEITASINRVLERWIRDDADQWRWIHWRWKARPDGRSETYTRADLRSAFARPDSRARALDARGEA